MPGTWRAKLDDLNSWTWRNPPRGGIVNGAITASGVLIVNAWYGHSVTLVLTTFTAAWAGGTTVWCFKAKRRLKKARPQLLEPS